jgi:hypothetical protein
MIKRYKLLSTIEKWELLIKLQAAFWSISCLFTVYSFSLKHIIQLIFNV